MEFCPKCGTILVKKTKHFSCPKCRYVSREKIKLIASEKIENKNKINVLKKDASNVWPKVKETCPKCGNDEAYTHTVQMRSGDEGETIFFRCTKCSYQWRERG